jgi:hypothetical protein
MFSGWQNFFVDLQKVPASEHPVELAFPPAILKAMGTGFFRMRALQTGALDANFVSSTLFQDLPAAPQPPPLNGGYADLNIMKRIMWTMGTTENPDPFVIAESALNTRKMAVSLQLLSVVEKTPMLPSVLSVNRLPANGCR